MCMKPVELRQARAGLKMWMIRNYFHDLAEFYAGDENRFGRMVVDQGKSLPSAHPAGWTQHIVNCTTAEAIEFYRPELVKIYMQLISWRLLPELPATLSENEITYDLPIHE